jgi:hypothetical protein
VFCMSTRASRESWLVVECQQQVHQVCTWVHASHRWTTAAAAAIEQIDIHACYIHVVLNVKHPLASNQASSKRVDLPGAEMQSQFVLHLQPPCA